MSADISLCVPRKKDTPQGSITLRHSHSETLCRDPCAQSSKLRTLFICHPPATSTRSTPKPQSQVERDTPSRRRFKFQGSILWSPIPVSVYARRCKGPYVSGAKFTRCRYIPGSAEVATGPIKPIKIMDAQHTFPKTCSAGGRQTCRLQSRPLRSLNHLY